MKKITPNEFLIECATAFADVAKRFGMAESGPMYIPALKSKTEQSVGELLQLAGFRKVFGQDPMMYYYHMLTLSFSMGVVLAMLWRNAKKKFDERNIVEMIANDPVTSPHELAFHTLSQFGVAIEIFNDLQKALYECFVKQMETHWKHRDQKDYLIVAFYASFIVGNSVVLDKIEKRGK